MIIFYRDKFIKIPVTFVQMEITTLGGSCVFLNNDLQTEKIFQCNNKEEAEICRKELNGIIQEKFKELEAKNGNDG